MHDLHYAFRMLIKSSGFSIVAIATLLLGIGPSTATLSLIHDPFWRGLTLRSE